MAWIKIAEGTKPDNVKSITNVAELGKDVEFYVDISTGWWPVAPIADIAGAEFATILMTEGAEVTDVEGIGSNKIRIHCLSDPIPIAGILLALTAMGVMAYMVSKIEVWADIVREVADITQWVAVGFMAICGIYVISEVSARRENEQQNRR